MALHSSHLRVEGLSPQGAFVEKGVITEQFVELYCYCTVRCMMEWGEMEPGQEVVIGWDPRDENGSFTGAAVRGILKAGARAVSAGVLPTPAIPLYMLNIGARLSLVITASHNPADQNGIKIFLPDTAMKPLPGEDLCISRKVLETDYRSLEGINEKRKAEDVSKEAKALFIQHCCQGRNSWLKKTDALNGCTIIVDPANGACTDIAAEIFRRLGAERVIQVNPSREGPVNRVSGVTEFEGNRYIGSDLMGNGGKDFSDNRAVKALFEAGRLKRNRVEAGSELVSGAVFDADGDRFYRLDYHPEDDRVVILTGDEIALLQAEHLMNANPEVYRNSLFITTVESDANVVSHAEKLGFETALTGVGDKWILRKIAECRITGVGPGGAIDQQSALSYNRLLREGTPGGRSERYTISVGSEESGHTITPGWLEDMNGVTLPVYIGNGVKSAVNSFAAMASLRSRLSTRDFWRHLQEPFPPGFKKTFYAYHTDKTRFRRGTPTWNGLESVLRRSTTDALEGNCRLHRKRFSEEQDMLFISVREGESSRAAIFARNSGTEDKASINIRGREEDSELFSVIGLHGIAYLAGEIKSDATPSGRASLGILELLYSEGPQTVETLKGLYAEVDVERLLDEMFTREKSLHRQGAEVQLSSLGENICRRRFGDEKDRQTVEK